MDTTLKQGQNSVFEIVNNVARPLQPIKTPEEAAKWYESANLSITQSAEQTLVNIRSKAQVRAAVIAAATVVGAATALFFAWQIASAVIGLGVAAVGVLGMTWLYFKKDSLITRWRIEHEVEIIRLAALRDRQVLTAKQDALTALKEQAAKNPVATRQLQAEERRGVIQIALQRASSLKGKTERAAQKLAEHKVRFPNRPQPEMEAEVAGYRKDYDDVVMRANQASVDLDAFVAETELLQARLELAADGKALAEFLGASGANEERDRILREFATSQALNQSQVSIALLQTAMSTDNVSGKF